jgi:hypothetical protein
MPFAHAPQSCVPPQPLPMTPQYCPPGGVQVAVGVHAPPVPPLPVPVDPPIEMTPPAPVVPLKPDDIEPAAPPAPPEPPDPVPGFSLVPAQAARTNDETRRARPKRGMSLRLSLDKEKARIPRGESEPCRSSAYETFYRKKYVKPATMVGWLPR